MPVRIPGSLKMIYLGLRGPESIQAGPLACLTGLIFFVFCCSYLTGFSLLGFSYTSTLL